MDRIGQDTDIHKSLKPVLFFLGPIFILLMLLSFTNYFHPGGIIDEIWHLKEIKLFDTIIKTKNFGLYSSPYPPVGLFLFYIYGLFVNFSLPAYRALIALISILNFIIFFRICQEQKINRPYLVSLFLFFSPYYFLLSVTLHWEMPGLFFGLLALYYFLRFNDTSHDLYLGSLFSLLAVWVNSRLIFIPLGFIFYIIATESLKSHSAYIKARKIAFYSTPPLLVLFSIFLLFFFWGGIIPPALQKVSPGTHKILLNLKQISFIFVFLGFYFFIYISVNYKRIVNRKHALTLLCLLFYFIFPLPWEGTHFLGLIPTIICALRDYSFILGSIFFIAGILIFFDFFNREGNPTIIHDKLFYFFISFALLMTVSIYVWERYYFFCLPILILLVYKKVDLSKLIYFYCWLGFQTIISGTYIAYKVMGK